MLTLLVFHLLAAQLHEDVTHDALPLALEHAVLQGVQEVQVLLDEEAQRAGKRPAGGDTKHEPEAKNKPKIVQRAMAAGASRGNNSEGHDPRD